jgi:rubrerythrin
MGENPVGPVEALKLALGMEMDAVEFYQRMAGEHRGSADIFQFLVNEETKHRQLIEKKIQELTRD